MKGQDSKRSTERKRAKKTVDTASRPTGASARPGATPPEATRQRPQARSTPSPKARRAPRAPVKTAPDTVRKPGRTAAPARAVERGGTKQASFPIVAIGASAGGLEAMEQFLKGVPGHSGMAFVVVQHLDPTHKGLMAELLQRVSAIPVDQVRDRLRVEPNHVYVIPPNKDMSILHGVLHLLPRPHGLNLPIDFFFRSLAEDQRERSVGVVLSGMGSDGTLGLRAIKEKAGATFVQAPTSAKFDSMPRSAIDAGFADVVAPVEDLPARIMAYHQHAPFIAQPDTPSEEEAEGGLEKVFVLLRTQTGNDFSLYKRSTIYRRVERRMGLHQIDELPSYVRFLRETPAEIDLLFKELLIGVTSFFRDPPAWEQLKSEVAALVSARPKGGALRAWVPGCSTGEEAYSLAMVFKEVLEQLEPGKAVTLQLFATDLDAEGIEKARSGVFPANVAADVSPERLSRFFVREERGYRVGKEIREMVVFAPQNLIMAPPFTKLDILSCRNLLIYLSSDLHKKLIPLFHYCLNPSGILFLGSAETIGSFSNLFSPLGGKARLYRRSEASVSVAPIDFPSSFAPRAPNAAGEVPALKAPPANLQVLADRTIAQRVTPPVVLTNDQGDIIYISGRTGKYLEPAAGKMNVNIFAMAREGLRYELSGAFSAALGGEGPAIVRGLEVGTNGGTQTIDLTVEKLAEPKELKGTMMIVFADVAKAPAPSPRQKGGRIPASTSRLADLEKEMRQAHEALQLSREKMQTSQEELKSANEELQSTNEELQSTNEELTTSKEEMQSMNEELQTLNHELQAKVDELSQTNDDMKNLLNSTEIATLFLDGELRVRRFTPQASKIIKLIPGDAGRPFTDLVTALDYPEFADDAREVLQTLIFKEKRVAASDNRWFSVRIMPYRTLANVIAGLVITFAQETRKHLSEKTSSVLESLPDAVFSLDRNLSITYSNAAAEHMLKRKCADLLGKPLGSVLPRAAGAVFEKKVRRLLAEKVPLAFDMRVEATPSEARYGVRVFPQEKGFSVFFQRRETAQVDDDPQATGGT
jgi:two-component system CheB/CheR fusion protein